MSELIVNYGQGAQTIATVVTTSLGFDVRPSAATMQLIDRRPGVVEIVVDEVAATVDPVDTTTTVACGRSSGAERTITLTSVTGVVAGKRYLLTNPSGESETVTVTAVQATPKTVLVYAEPRYGYPIGSAFQGLEVSATVPAPVCNDDEQLVANLVVLWTFTGVSPARTEDALVIIRPLPSWATVTDVLQLEPTLNSKHADLPTALAMAHREFAGDLRLATIDPHTFRGTELAKLAVTYLAAYHMLKTASEDSTRERANFYREQYQKFLTGLTVGADKPGVTTLEPTTGSVLPFDIHSLFSGL